MHRSTDPTVSPPRGRQGLGQVESCQCNAACAMLYSASMNFLLTRPPHTAPYSHQHASQTHTSPRGPGRVLPVQLPVQCCLTVYRIDSDMSSLPQQPCPPPPHPLQTRPLSPPCGPRSRAASAAACAMLLAPLVLWDWMAAAAAAKCLGAAR